VGTCGSFVESDFYTELKKLDVQQGKKNKLSADHATQVREAHDRVILSMIQQVQRIYEANHRGIKGEHWTQCASVRRCQQEHKLKSKAGTRRTIVHLGW